MGKQQFRSITRAFKRGRLRLFSNPITQTMDLFRQGRGNNPRRHKRTGKLTPGHLGRKFASLREDIPTNANTGKHWIPA